MKHTRTLFAAVVAAASLLAGAPSYATSDPIQPGDYMETSVGSCTLNFVYDGTGARAGKVYMGTAAHCVSGVGQDIYLLSGELFGDVAVIGNAGNTADDWALIEVRAAYVPRVIGTLKGHTGIPRDYTVPTDTTIGDLVQLSGYGVGYGTNSVTQERRVAVLMSDDANVHRLTGPIHFGDSGGPKVHIKTGKALGIVSRLCIGACSEEGATVQGILNKAAAKGFPVSLRNG